MLVQNFFLLALFCFLFWTCRSGDRPAPPVLSPAEYVLADSFRLECIAAEPLLDAPVALSFDVRGRLWVAEMRGYMTDLDNSGERRASGRISILEDRDADGFMDHRTTFLDSLVLPRALALVYGGLLYAEPPNLWFVPIHADRPGPRSLVDSTYATGGNVEHQPNGLLPALDNWIYSAKYDRRYRLKNGRWLREKTHFRGQWGIAQDAYGRLFYNDNSNQLQGDLLLPNALLRNPFFMPSTGYNIQVCTDQRVYPLLPTAVNRGYEPGALDSAGRLRLVTSACGPLIYRGGQFPPEYAGNAFVCAPEANAVKRNVFDPETPGRLQARQAYSGREFLAATDPGFRPVNLYDGPDGGLYIVDMHRGIIQHKTYMTAYLREQILARRLDTIAGQGRILRVTHTGRPLFIPPDLDKAAWPELVALLGHPNAWVRDNARQLLIQRGERAAVPLLHKIVLDSSRPHSQLQALWTLEGMDALQPGLLLQAAAEATQPWVTTTALHLLEPFAGPSTAGATLPVLNRLAARAEPTIDLALGLYAGAWGRFAREPVYAVLLSLVHRHPADTLFQEALLSGLSGQEEMFLEFLQNNTRPAIAPYLKKMLFQTATARRENHPAAWTLEPVTRRDKLTAGLTLYNQFCGACHGPTGQGTPHLAPPLDGSEFIHGPATPLVRIALHGLQGPVRVKGTLYTFNAPMPGLYANPDCTDSDLAAVLTYVRNAFSREPMEISVEMVRAQRAVKPPDGVAFTAEELLSRTRH